jgi:hypothetical protein
MGFRDLESMSTRAAIYSGSKVKLFISSLTLVICGLLVVFAMGLSLAASEWVTLSLAFLPIFLSGSILIALGVVLIRGYRDEVKNKEVSYGKMLGESWGNLITSSYFFLPIVLVYLCLWVVMGLFFLLKEIPGIGDFFGVILAFGPFLLILGSLLLCVATVFLVFALSPILALKQISGNELMQYVQERLSKQVFLRAFLFLFSSLPLIATAALLYIAARLTTILYVVSDSHIQMVLQWFFIMIPFAVILSPALVFFFNMAAETHILIQKRLMVQK